MCQYKPQNLDNNILTAFHTISNTKTTIAPKKDTNSSVTGGFFILSSFSSMGSGDAECLDDDDDDKLDDELSLSESELLLELESCFLSLIVQKKTVK